METVLGLGAGALLLAIFLWALPILLIARSGKTSGLEKLVWILLIVFFSWFAWILYWLVAPLQPENQQ